MNNLQAVSQAPQSTQNSNELPATRASSRMPATYFGICLLLVIITGAVSFYLGMTFKATSKLSTPIATPSPISNLVQPIASTPPNEIESKESVINALIGTQNLQQYSENFFAFKYPSSWNLDSTSRTLTSPQQNFLAQIVSPGEPLMNECMKISNQELKPNQVLITYFASVQGAEACSNPEAWDEREIWISDSVTDNTGSLVTRSDGNYEVSAPGVIVKFRAEHAAEVEPYAEVIAATMEIAP